LVAGHGDHGSGDNDHLALDRQDRAAVDDYATRLRDPWDMKSAPIPAVTWGVDLPGST
jgi:hypothetical protein